MNDISIKLFKKRRTKGLHTCQPQDSVWEREEEALSASSHACAHTISTSSFPSCAHTASYTQWKRHMQMPLIRAGHISHHYAALCKLQLIPAYYPNTESFCLISGGLAAAEEKQHRRPEEARLTYNPCCCKDSSPPGLINSNQVGTRRLRTTATSSFICEHVPPNAIMRRWTEGQTSLLVLGGFFGGGVMVKKSNKSKPSAYTKTGSLPLLSPSPY